MEGRGCIDISKTDTKFHILWCLTNMFVCVKTIKSYFNYSSFYCIFITLVSQKISIFLFVFENLGELKLYIRNYHAKK